MRTPRYLPFAAALLLSMAPPISAQTATDPAGHWEGSIDTPSGTKMPFIVDVTKSAPGKLAAYYTSPTEKVKALPFLNASAAGSTVTLQIRQSGTLKGTLSGDGKTLAGNYTAVDFTGTEITLPFTLNKTGAARIEPRPKSAKVSKDLVGAWDGTIEVNGFKVQLKLRFANQPDGTAIGGVTNVTRGEAEIPIADITQKASTVTFKINVVGATYVGTLNAAGNELAGKWTQETGDVMPLTFKRAAADARKTTTAGDDRK